MENQDGDRAHRATLGGASADTIGRVTRAYIGLGANLGDAAGSLAAAVRALDALPGARVAGVSRLYATEPVGPVDQPEFRNAVAALEVRGAGPPSARAVDLLVELKALERSGGRTPRERWGPREIDLDLLAFGRNAISVERPPEGQSVDVQVTGVKLLVVPHPSARERLFVLAPWADLAPRLVPPGWGETVESARRRRAAIEGPDAVRPIGRWDSQRRAWRSMGDGPAVASARRGQRGRHRGVSGP
jgi:2-amino-4-hydroxy-6-hydroxymethyldihydropteridine diphosphokinase